MRGSKVDIPVAFESAEGSIRVIEWGGMSIELASFRQEIDTSSHFKGLPDDRCQCPHWGYVLQGQLHFTFVDHKEVYHAGDVYYAAPGHTAVIGALPHGKSFFVRFNPLFSSDSERVCPPRPQRRSAALEREKHMAFVREKEKDVA
jgi:hypothetical protein